MYLYNKNCDISEAFIKVIEIARETSQISATSHTSSSYDSNKVNNTFVCLSVLFPLFINYTIT